MLVSIGGMPNDFWAGVLQKYIPTGYLAQRQLYPTSQKIADGIAQKWDCDTLKPLRGHSLGLMFLANIPNNKAFHCTKQQYPSLCTTSNSIL